MTIGSVNHPEPIGACEDRVESMFKELGPFKCVSCKEDLEGIEGYLKGDSTLPHVFENGVFWWPNALLARIAFLSQNGDVEEATMWESARDVEKVFCGFIFYRFERVQ